MARNKYQEMANLLMFRFIYIQLAERLGSQRRPTTKRRETVAEIEVLEASELM